jgi:hypothetical protein
LSDDPKLRQRAAEFLRKQGKEDLAREVETANESRLSSLAAIPGQNVA